MENYCSVSSSNNKRPTRSKQAPDEDTAVSRQQRALIAYIVRDLSVLQGEANRHLDTRERLQRDISNLTLELYVEQKKV